MKNLVSFALVIVGNVCFTSLCRMMGFDTWGNAFLLTFIGCLVLMADFGVIKDSVEDVNWRVLSDRLLRRLGLCRRSLLMDVKKFSNAAWEEVSEYRQKCLDLSDAIETIREERDSALTTIASREDIIRELNEKYEAAEYLIKSKDENIARLHAEAIKNEKTIEELKGIVEKSLIDKTDKTPAEKPIQKPAVKETEQPKNKPADKKSKTSKRAVGDINPENGKVWTEYSEGKFGWRTPADKKGIKQPKEAKPEHQIGVTEQPVAPEKDETTTEQPKNIVDEKKDIAKNVRQSAIQGIIDAIGERIVNIPVKGNIQGKEVTIDYMFVSRDSQTDKQMICFYCTNGKSYTSKLGFVSTALLESMFDYCLSHTLKDHDEAAVETASTVEAEQPKEEQTEQTKEVSVFDIAKEIVETMKRKKSVKVSVVLKSGKMTAEVYQVEKIAGVKDDVKLLAMAGGKETSAQMCKMKSLPIESAKEILEAVKSAI